MKKIIVVIILLIGSTSGYSQSSYFIGAGAGLNFINDNVLSTTVAGAEFQNKSAFVFPAKAGVYIGDKSRISFDLGSFRLRSKLNYNYTTSQSDPMVPNYSEVSIKTQLFNLNYDYRFFGTEKFECYSSAGVRALFSTNKKESTTYLDGGQKETEILVQDFNRNLFGVGIGLISKYNYIRNLSMTFTPDYAVYFGSFNKGDNNNLRRLSLSIGIECRL